MNIFAVYEDPEDCAAALDDRRLVKMVLETAQLLSGVIRSRPAFMHSLPEDAVLDEIGVYRKTHMNHPCAVWGRESLGNFRWLYRLFVALCNEYTRRYGKVHMSRRKLGDFFFRQLVQSAYTGAQLTSSHPNCTDFKQVADVHEAYRLHLSKKWLGDIAVGRPPRWTKRESPTFYVDAGILARAQHALLSGQA